MALVLSKTGITDGNKIEPGHVTQSVDALTGIEAYDITISGSLNLSGSTMMYGTASNAITSSYTQTALTSSYSLTSLTSSYSLLSEEANGLNDVRTSISGSVSISSFDMKLIIGSDKTDGTGTIKSPNFSEIAGYTLGDTIFVNATYITQGTDPLFVYQVTNSGSIRISGSANQDVMYTAWYRPS
jgi:hypothetical protein